MNLYGEVPWYPPLASHGTLDTPLKFHLIRIMFSDGCHILKISSEMSLNNIFNALWKGPTLVFLESYVHFLGDLYRPDICQRRFFSFRSYKLGWVRCIRVGHLTIPTAFSLLREAEWRRRSHVAVCENTSSMQYSTIHRLYQCHLIPPVHMNSMVCRDALKPKELSSAKGIDSIFLTPSHIVSLELEPISLSDTLLRYYCQNKNEYRRFHWGRGCLQLTLGWYWLPQPLLVQL